MDTTTPSEPTEPPEPSEPSEPSEPPGGEKDYFEKIEYKKIEKEVNEWISQHTNMDAVPSNQEKCANLATSLSELLLTDNPDLHGKIKAIVPVEDDFFSILEQESSHSDLN